MAEAGSLLELRGIRAGYGKGEVLHGIDLTLDEGRLLAVLGANGAGKSTMLRVIAGLHPARAGSVRLAGRDLGGHPASERARCGLYLVPEGRAVFPGLTVADNLRLATGRPERQWQGRMAATLDLFPRLGERLHQLAGTMSGGERQMLSLARAWLADPRVLLLDEPSLGLAPIVVDEVFQSITGFRDRGTTVVLVEQYVHRALAVADRVVVLSKGDVAFAGAPGDVAADEIASGYLGAGAVLTS